MTPTRSAPEVTSRPHTGQQETSIARSRLRAQSRRPAPRTRRGPSRHDGGTQQPRVRIQAAGDFSRAIALHEHALEEFQRVLGADHPATLTACNNLASAYSAAGEPRRAIPLYEQTLADRTRTLGEDHPATLTTSANLASALRAAGDLDQAVPLYERTLHACRRVLGVDHRLTRIVGSNLAAVLGGGDRHGDQTARRSRRPRRSARWSAAGPGSALTTGGAGCHRQCSAILARNPPEEAGSSAHEAA